jgi:Ankyrin repeats (3 copies)
MVRRNEIFTIITHPRRADVLFGSGFEQQMHPGNVQYRQMIDKRRSEYQTTIHDKNKIAREIVNAVVAKKGRFLKKLSAADAKEAGVSNDVSAWIIVDDDAAIMEKVKGALRRNDSSSGKQTATTTTRNRSKNSSMNSQDDDGGEDDASAIIPMESASSTVVAAVGTTTTTATPRRPSLFQAAMDGDKEMIGQLLRQGDATVSERDENGFTPLMFACYHGHVHAARYLLKKGAATDEHYVDLQDNTGCTALYWAATQAHVRVACLLLKRGASVAIANQVAYLQQLLLKGSTNSRNLVDLCDDDDE